MVSIGTVQRPSPRRWPSEAELLQWSLNAYRLAIRTADKIVVLDPRDGNRTVYPIPAAIGRRTIGLYQLDNETVIATVRRKAADASFPTEIYWIPPGAEAERHEVVRLKRQSSEPDARVMSALGGLLVPAPAAWAVVATVVGPLTALASGQASDYTSALAELLSGLWPGLLISLVLAMVISTVILRAA